MDKIKLLLLIGLSFLLVNCNKIVLALYGVKQPEVKTEKQITNYIQKIGMGPDNHYGVDINSFVLALKEKGFPRILLFNRDGKLLVPVDTAIKGCSGKVSEFLLYLKDTTQYTVIDSLNFDKYTTGLKHLDGREAEKPDVSKNDITAIIYWATFAGRLNKESPMVWESTLRKYDDLKIEVIKINLDVRDFWSEENLKRLRKKK